MGCDLCFPAQSAFLVLPKFFLVSEVLSTPSPMTAAVHITKGSHHTMANVWCQLAHLTAQGWECFYTLKEWTSVIVWKHHQAAAPMAWRAANTSAKHHCWAVAAMAWRAAEHSCSLCVTVGNFWIQRGVVLNFTKKLISISRVGIFFVCPMSKFMQKVNLNLTVGIFLFVLCQILRTELISI